MFPTGAISTILTPAPPGAQTLRTLRPTTPTPCPMGGAGARQTSSAYWKVPLWGTEPAFKGAGSDLDASG